jgi:hypothetical protein
MKKQVNRPSAQSRPSRTRQVSYDAPQAPPAPRRNSLR